MTPRRGHPHHAPAGPLPIHVRPVHGECTGSYLIRLATGNRCPPRTLLRLLGRVHHRAGPDHGVELHPQSTITLNTAALHRLGVYSGTPIAHLLRALPELDHEHSTSHEPILRVGPAQRSFLRSCPECERRAGGAHLAPQRSSLQLTCPRHGIWLVNADPPLNTHLVPEIHRATRQLLRQQQRHTADIITALYRDIREYLTHDWRGLGWHTHLTSRWTTRQQILRPDTTPKDLYLLARTEHWSMLPETAAIITVLANYPRGTPHPTVKDHRHLARTLSRALHLENYWSIGTNDHLDPDHSFRPLHQHTAEQARPLGRTTSSPNRSPQPASIRAARSPR
jgi:hypothetical protein